MHLINTDPSQPASLIHFLHLGHETLALSDLLRCHKDYLEWRVFVDHGLVHSVDLFAGAGGVERGGLDAESVEGH